MTDPSSGFAAVKPANVCSSETFGTDSMHLLDMLAQAMPVFQHFVANLASFGNRNVRIAYVSLAYGMIGQHFVTLKTCHRAIMWVGSQT